VSLADWIALAVIIATAVGGVRRGLVTGVLSLGGLVAGAIVGARAVPGLVGSLGGWTPLVALFGAALGGILGQTVGLFVGHTARKTMLPLPPLRILDSAGGVLLGALTGLALCWVVGAALLYAPDQSDLRRFAQESSILSGLTEALPPERVMDALERVDTFSAIVGPATGVAEPDPAIAHDPEVAAARSSVVRIRGFACGLGIEGSGWIVRPGFVVTNAHVVAGVHEPVIDKGDGHRTNATVVAFDAGNDVAILKAPGLEGRPLPLAEPEREEPAAILGYPLDGPYVVTAGRLGDTARVAARDAYGRVNVGRSVVGFRGTVERGNSGGPVVDRDGNVVTTVFARRHGSDDGYGVPNDAVRSALGKVGPPLETACVEE
jgi:S1-C subfamily serine protease